jgi:hypothetical protein
MERGWAKEPDHRPTLADFQTAIAPEMLRLRELAAARTEEQLRNLAGTLLTRENALRAGEIALREREASVRTLEEDVRQREAVLAAARKDFAREQQALAAFPAQENRSRTPPTVSITSSPHSLARILITVLSMGTTMSTSSPASPLTKGDHLRRVHFLRSMVTSQRNYLTSSSNLRVDLPVQNQRNPIRRNQIRKKDGGCRWGLFL